MRSSCVSGATRWTVNICGLGQGVLAQDSGVRLKDGRKELPTSQHSEATSVGSSKECAHKMVVYGSGTVKMSCEMSKQ